MLKNITEFDKRNYKIFNSFIFKKQFLPKIIMIFVAFCLLSATFFIWDWLIGAAMLLGVLFFGVLFIFRLKRATQKEVERIDFLKQVTEYDFDIDEVHIKSTNAYANENIKINYNAFISIIETPFQFLLFVNVTSAYIVDKSKFENASSDLLTDILRIKPNYKLMYKK